jgi:hypothetical protein
MALLVEKLLLAKGAHLPHREAAVIAAMEILPEPPGIVKRRLAREAALRSLYAPEDFLGPFIVASEEDRKTWAMTNSREDGVAMEVPLTPDMMRNVPPDLHPYLTDEVDQEIAFDVQMYAKVVMSTGGIYRLDGGEDGIMGVLDSVWGGLPLTELPPLPYPRMWFEARGPDGEPVPLWETEPPEGAWNGPDSRELWGLAVTEIAPGSVWGLLAMRKPDWTYRFEEGSLRRGHEKFRPGDWMASTRYERVSIAELNLLTPDSPRGMFALMDDDDDVVAASEGAYRGAMLAWAIVLADVVTARNVDRREWFLSRKAQKQMSRVAPRRRFESRVYDVSIATATGDAKDETGRHLSVRFLVRGHWRVSHAEHARYIDAKEAHCVWVAAYVKGPPGAPWKGRPVYTEQTGGSR